MVAPNLQMVPREGGIITAVNPEMKTLYAKIARVMGRIAPVEKTGENTFHHYKFQTAEAIANAVRNILAEEGVAFFVSMSSINQEERKTDKDKPTTLTTATFDFTFACSETGATITHRWFAESLNNGDKGINQVATAAAKYFLMKTFLISTPDETDADTTSHERGGSIPQLNIAELRKSSRFMFADDASHKAMIDFLLASETITGATSLNTALAHVLITQASQKYQYDLDQIIATVNTTLAEDEQVTSYGDYIKAGHTHTEAWEAIAAHAELANAKPAEPKNGAKSFGAVVEANTPKKAKKPDLDMLAAPADAPDPKEDAPNPS